MAVTISSDAADGTHVEITLAKIAPDKGNVRVKQWPAGTDSQNQPPSQDDAKDLYDVAARKDGSKIACKADISGPDPTVTFTFHDAQAPAQPNVTVTIKGTLFGIGDGTTVYDITANDVTKIKKFVTDSKFPELA